MSGEGQHRSIDQRTMRRTWKSHPGQRDELLVCDELEPCPYLPDRTARLPLRWPGRSLSREEIDQRLAAANRRSGFCLYRPDCPSCCACEAIRIDVTRFRPNRSQQRIERQTGRLLEVTIGSPQVDEQRVRLFNEHRESRGLASADDRADAADYKAFLVDTCCETFELSYRLNGRMIGVAICDRGQQALSAVYCYYDVAYARLSPGVFSILTQIRLCLDWQLRHLYLGYYVAGSPHMSYKALYRPHERWIRGSWQESGREERPGDG